jgi:MYXO-CTERM domain-containing protein
MKKSISLSLLATALLGLSSAAQAISLDFWTLSGDAALRSGALPSLSLSTPNLVLGTSTVDVAEDAPAPAGAFNMSGVNPIAAGLDLEASVGLSGGALDNEAAMHYAMEGSSAWKDVQVNQGDTLTMVWQFFSRPQSSADAAWLVWTQGSSTQLISLGDASSLNQITDASSGWQRSGLQQTVLTASFTGLARVGVVVADMDSFDGASVMAVSSLTQTSPVPESGTWALALAGLGLVGALRKRAVR